MAELNPPQGGPDRMVKVWDLPIRLFHWALATLFTALWVSGRMGKLGPHMMIGEALLALLLFRLAWGVLGSSTARFSGFVRGPGAVLGYLASLRRGTVWPGIGHNPVGGWSTVAMLTALLVQVLCGLFATDDIATDGPLAWMVSSHATKLLSAIHRLDCWVLLGLVALHLAAITFYRFAKGDDLVRPMILGVKTSGHPAPRMGSPWLALGLFTGAVALVFATIAVWGR